MRPTVESLASLVEIVLWHDGGQRRARRNAWAAMVADAARAHARAEADAALQDRGQEVARATHG